jgi:LysR family glycine cleavage system transcriptional activator
MRIPPIQCLLTFEALARLRSVTQTADELCVTPSAVSHRVKQLEQIIGTKLFGRADFSLTTEGSEYLAHVREGLATLQKFPGAAACAGQAQAAPGGHARPFALDPDPAAAPVHRGLPRDRRDAAGQSIPLLDVVAEDADLMVRFGTGRYADVEHICLMKDEVTPLASPAFVREHGPFDNPQDLEGAALLRSPLEPWRTWFAAQRQLDWPEPVDGSSVQRHRPDVRRRRPGHGRRPDPPQAGRALAGKRLAGAACSARHVPSPHAHYLCWRTGAMDRWECAAFAEWLKKSVA